MDTLLTEDQQTRYQSGTGSLLYLVKHTRPDIANAVRELTKAMDKATAGHYKQLLRIIKFVSDTKTWGISMTKINHLTLNLTCYTDSDWAGDADDRRSISGWCIFIHGNLLCWGSRSQKNVTMSSTEAEYVEISDVCKEIMYAIYVLEFLGTKVNFPVKIYVDNVGAIYIANNNVTRRTKHIDVRYHIIREHIEDGIIKLQFIRSDENLSDIFTKNVFENTYLRMSGHFMTRRNNELF